MENLKTINQIRKDMENKIFGEAGHDTPLLRSHDLPRHLTEKPKPDNVKKFELLGAEKALLYARKNADYGDSFNKSLDEDGLLVAKIRMNDKMLRFEQLIKNPAKVTEEKLRETLIDLSNYADMTIMWLDDKEEAEQRRKMMEAYSPIPAGAKNNDALDAAAYAVAASGADWDGDFVNGQYINIKEGVIGDEVVKPKVISTSNPKMTDLNNGNTYNIHIHADSTIDTNKLSSIISESMKRIGVKDFE